MTGWVLIAGTVVGLAVIPFYRDFNRSERLRLALAMFGIGASAVAWEWYRVPGSLLLVPVCSWFYLSVWGPVAARRAKARIAARHAASKGP